VVLASALAQGRFEVAWPSVLTQEVAESLVRQFLKFHHAVAGEQIKGRPRFIVELHTLARH
jgi:hypothetical protein